MAYEESPQLDEFKTGIPKKLPDPDETQRRVRITIRVLAVLLVLLTILNIFQSNRVPQIVSGKGSVVGTVLDESGQPLIADIFVVGTDIEDQTGETGGFNLLDIPSGIQSIVVALEESGVEYKVNVIAGSVVNLGRIQIVSTATPEE